MNRINMKRGATVINVAETNVPFYEDIGFKKVTDSAPKKATRRTRAKSADDE